MRYLNHFNPFRAVINQLLDASPVRSMQYFIQHADVTCLEHCIFVAYLSFVISRFFGLNAQAAARGALLHDLFLYDWHKQSERKGLHGFTHPTTALNNASHYFELNEIEKDIIEKHMWPLTLKLPKYAESAIVCLSDKICTMVEVFRLYRWLEKKSLIPNTYILLPEDRIA